ncbi:hypothetical protein, partial [Mycobacterium tuberculosis]
METLLTCQNAEGETALYIAARNRRERVVHELITGSARALSPPDLEDGEGVVSLTEKLVRIPNKNGDTP